MHKPTVIGCAASMSLALAACSPSIGGGAGGHSIRFDGSAIALHAPAQPTALVSSNGDLVINGSAIATTPAQRALLQRLYREAHALLGTGESQMRDGLDVAAQTAMAKLASILHAHDTGAGRRDAALSSAMAHDDTVQCQDAAAIATTERALAATLDPFAPYASTDASDCPQSAVSAAMRPGPQRALPHPYATLAAPPASRGTSR